MAKPTGVAKPKKRFEYLRNTHVEEVVCGTCGEVVLAAYDGGLWLRAGKEAVAPAAEYDVIMSGRQTFTRRPHGFGLVWRDAAEIGAGLYPGETIHIEHHHRRST